MPQPSHGAFAFENDGLLKQENPHAYAEYCEARWRETADEVKRLEAALARAEEERDSVIAEFRTLEEERDDLEDRVEELDAEVTRLGISLQLWMDPTSAGVAGGAEG